MKNDTPAFVGAILIIMLAGAVGGAVAGILLRLFL